MERLQKVLAMAGLGSRRSCEQLILEGRVSVDKKVITELGTKVDVEQQKIYCDGEIVRVPKKVYYMFNKPRRVLCTTEEKHDEKTVMDFFRGLSFQIFPVGRLDKDSEGLLLMTNDGAFTQKVLHPKYGVNKRYWVRVKGVVTSKTIQQVTSGLWFKEGKMKLGSVKILEAKEKYTLLEVGLSEGKNREIRRIMARVGHEVKRLIRVKIGNLALGQLESGKYQVLNAGDVDKIFQKSVK